MQSAFKGFGRRNSEVRTAALAAATIIGAAISVALLSTGQAALERSHHGADIPWVGIMLAQFTDAFSYSIFVPALLLLARRVPFRAGQIPLYLLVTLAAALAKEAIVVAVAEQFRPGVFSLPTILAEDYCSEVLTFCALVAVSHLAVRQGSARSEPRQVEQETGEEGVVRASNRQGSLELSAASVEWAEAQGNYVLLHTDTGRILLRRTLAGLMEELGSGFVRVHRRAVVNAARVARIQGSRGGSCVLLLSGTRVRVGRSYADDVRRRWSHRA